MLTNNLVDIKDLKSKFCVLKCALPSVKLVNHKPTFDSGQIKFNTTTSRILYRRCLLEENKLQIDKFLIKQRHYNLVAAGLI